MPLKCCTQYGSKFGKLSSGYRTRIHQFHSSPNEGQCERIALSISLILYASKLILKILQAKLQQYMNYELSEVQAGFR